MNHQYINSRLRTSAHNGCIPAFYPFSRPANQGGGKTMKKIIILTLGVILLSSLFLFWSDLAAAEEKKLPKMFIWGSLRAGSLGHSQSSALGEAVRKSTGVPVKVVPAGAEMAAFIPTRAREFHACYRATSSIYSLTYGVGEAYAVQSWGPQPIRILWALPLSISFCTRPDSGIKSWADLKGKKVPNYKGWETGVLDIEAGLASAGITHKDVTMIPTPGYIAGVRGFMSGKLDIADIAPESALAYEVASKFGDIAYLESPKDQEGINRWLQIAPFFPPAWATRGAGLSPEKPVWATMMRYTLLTWSHLDEELAYTITKALWEGYDTYKELHPSLKYATREIAIDYKSLIAPYHEGAVKFFKEVGVWTSDMEKWQQGQLALQPKLKAAWEEGLKAAAAKKLKLTDPKWNDPVNGMWVTMLRERNLIAIPKVEYTPYKK
jgi:TRAP transporter TAXI family solute receptor